MPAFSHLYHALLGAIGILETYLAQVIVTHPYAGVVILIVAVAVESFPFFGNFLVGSLLLVGTGPLIMAGQLNLWVVLLAGISGAILGEALMYHLGRYFQATLLQRRFFQRYRNGLQRAQNWFDRWGAWAVFWGRWPPGIHAFIAVIAGINKLAPGKFYTGAIASALVWAPPHVLIGMYTLGKLL